MLSRVLSAVFRVVCLGTSEQLKNRAAAMHATSPATLMRCVRASMAAPTITHDALDTWCPNWHIRLPEDPLPGRMVGTPRLELGTSCV